MSIDLIRVFIAFLAKSSLYSNLFNNGDFTIIRANIAKKVRFNHNDFSAFRVKIDSTKFGRL